MKSITLEEMKQCFDEMYQNSVYKEELLKDEIEGYSLIFDKNKLPLTGFSNNDKPLRAYEIPYSSQQIFLIREFHRRYNVRSRDISKMYKEDWDSWTQEIYNSAWGGYLEPNELAEPHGPKYYIELAEKLYKYLEWLKDQALAPKRDKKEYKSLTRARAICILLLQLKIDELSEDKKHELNFMNDNGTWNKKEIFAFVKKKWPKRENGEAQSQQAVYQYINSSLAYFKENNFEDYKFGEKLFNDFKA